jgi:hypothetical protein
MGVAFSCALSSATTNASKPLNWWKLNAEVEADGAVLDYGDYECPTLAESTKGQPDSNIFRMVRCMAKVPYNSRLAPTEPHCGLTTLAET